MTRASDSASERLSGLLLRYRGRTGLTQREFAARVGASRRAVQGWEAGAIVPSADRLQTLIDVLFQAQGLTVGQEALEAHALWTAALREPLSRLRAPLDEEWLAGVLARDALTLGTAGPTQDGGEDALRQDWGEAPDVTNFVGRSTELETCRRWLLQEGCHLLALLGMGGIGKTTLAARLAQDVGPDFQCLYWRSLRNALPFSTWLTGAIGFLSDHQLVPPPRESERVAMLQQLLRERRSLLVLDNFETLLEPGQPDGLYRADCAGYGQLLHTIGEGRHQSSLVLTSREAPPELSALGSPAVRTFQVGGLQPADGQALLAQKRLRGNSEDWAKLTDRFGGNGLALKVVSERIRQLFNGDIVAFLTEDSGSGAVFGDIRRLLNEQIGRSSALEQHVLEVLAVEREPVSLTALLTAIGPLVGHGAALDAIEALRRRSLVERVDADDSNAASPLVGFTLQSVVLEYVTDRLVEAVTDEIAEGISAQLTAGPLIEAGAKDYVRQAQERLLGAPILDALIGRYGAEATEQRLLALLDSWRGRSPEDQGYGPGNVVNLLRLMRDGDLRGLDLSRLAIRQAYLAAVEAQDASLAGAYLGGATLTEAFDFATCVSLSADGSWLAAGTSTGEVRLWRVADRTPILALHGHTGLVRGVVLSADGRLLASGGEDGTVCLWEAPTGQPLATLTGHTGGVWGLAMSMDGRLLASGSWDGTVRLWDAIDRKLLLTLDGPASGVRSVALSRNGRLVATASQDGIARLWEVPSGRLLATQQGPSSGVWGVALSADGRLLVGSSVDGTVWLWEVPTGQLLATLRGHRGGVWTVVLSADGTRLASCSQDGAVRLWEVPSGRPLATLQGHTGGVWGVAVSADGGLVASASQDGTVRLWDGPRGRRLATLQGHRSEVQGVALSGDGGLLASASQDGTLRLWDPIARKLLATLRGHTGGVVALSEDGRLLAGASPDGTLRTWAAPSAEPLATMQGHTGVIWSVALSADGGLLASASQDGTVRLWAASSGRLLQILQDCGGGVWGLALSADGRLLAGGGVDGTVRLWETSGGRLLGTLGGHGVAVWGVALSADGRLVASSGADGVVRLWDVPRRRPFATLQGHTSGIWGLALSADGRLLASGSDDGTARLWEVPSGRALATLLGHTSMVIGVALSSDARLLATSSGDGTVRLWETDVGICVAELRSELCYERLDITGLTGVTAAQRATLRALGAVENAIPGHVPD